MSVPTNTKKDDSSFYLSISPIIALVSSVFLVRGMSSQKYQLFWFLNNFIFVTLWGLMIIQMVRQSSVIFIPKAQNINISKIMKDQTSNTVDLMQTAKNAAHEHMLNSLSKKDRSSAETTFDNGLGN